MTCFSYVQHLIKEHAVCLWDLLSSKASIFLAGNSRNMPAGVKEAFVKDVACGIGQLSHNDAEQFLQNLENTGYFQSETWA
jgi:sulfite reductase alpha subunit-like flavoprotein